MSDRALIVTDWRGMPRYACPFCPYDTMEEGKGNEHVAVAHPVPAPPEPDPAPVPAKKRNYAKES